MITGGDVSAVVPSVGRHRSTMKFAFGKPRFWRRMTSTASSDSLSHSALSKTFTEKSSGIADIIDTTVTTDPIVSHPRLPTRSISLPRLRGHLAGSRSPHSTCSEVTAVNKPIDSRPSSIHTADSKVDLYDVPAVIIEQASPTCSITRDESDISNTVSSNTVDIAAPLQYAPLIDQATSPRRPPGFDCDLNNDLIPFCLPDPAATEALESRAPIHDSNAKSTATLIAPSSSPSSTSSPVRYSLRTADNSPSTTAPGKSRHCRSSAMPAGNSRKIWVKRPNASATLVQIKEDDLVDDVRDMILKKYANSLGRTFDAPDMTLRILQRAEPGAARIERVLGPEEEICRMVDKSFPGGQSVDEALLIDVPQKRTPRPSPRAYHYPNYQALDDFRPLENGTDYFPPMPALIPTSVAQSSGSHESRGGHHHVSQVPEHMTRSISVLNTGHVPPLPSPGGGRRRHGDHGRPKFQRTHTSSPNTSAHPNTASLVDVANINAAHVHTSRRGRVDSSASEAHLAPTNVPPAPPLPTPPAPEAPPTNKAGSTPPTPSGSTVAHPHRTSRAIRKSRKPASEKSLSRTAHRSSDSTSANPNLISSMLDGSVPPINVLIVEDNIINMRILEGLMKRLKVRWQTAVNGQIAVDKWKAGGFHLVLMDIQMPVMNGLQATKEIRRLERVNSIGVFSSTELTAGAGEDDLVSNEHSQGEAQDSSAGSPTNSADNDRLVLGDGLFKSPVIIVALTASSLQSDRHEALAAGCNDFLTKPVDFEWLERKVKEWGCMQALIDFDGWRKWKDYAAKEDAAKTEEQRQAERIKEEKQKVKMEKLALLNKKRAKKEAEERSKQRQSLEPGPSTPGVNGTVPIGPETTNKVAETA